MSALRPLAILLMATAAAVAADRIVFRGSVAVKPVVDAAAKAYTASHPDFALASSGSTSDISIQAVAAGEAQLGALVKGLSPEVQAVAPDLRTIPVAIDGLVLVVNAKNPVTGLTRAQVGEVFTGSAASWAAVGGPDRPIQPVVRMKSFASSAFFGSSFALEYSETGEGADKRMQHRPKGAEAWGPARALITDDHPKGLAKLLTAPDAITYAPYGIAQAMIAKGAGLRLLALDGVEPTPANIQAGTYAVTRPCLLLVKGEPAGALKDFIDFLVSPAGQQVVESCDYVPLAAKP